MKKLIIGISIACISSGNIAAQVLKVIKATQRGWSGGAYGRSGVGYTIELKSAGGDLSFDSVYIGNIGYALILDHMGIRNLSIDSIHHKYVISISEQHSFPHINRGNDPDEGDVKQVRKTPPPPPPPAPVRHFEGAALILYRYKGKQYTLLVKEMQVLPSVAYP